MKRLIFTVLFVLVLGTVYGQTRSENRWLLGRWVGEFRGTNVEIVLNDNGTGRFNDGVRFIETQDIVFSINGNTLTIFSSDGNSRLASFTIHRINDQRMVLDDLNFNKRN